MSKFLTVFCGLLLFASPLYAQDNKVYIGENDTIRYSYTPLQTDSIPASQPSDTLAAAPKKKSFWRRLIDYFGESSTDKTFEKKIDFTFIGGPSYSKDTQFSLAVMAAGLYRLDRTDSLTPPSDITAFITGGTTGFYMVGSTVTTYSATIATEFRTSSPSTRSRPTTGVSAIRPERIIPKVRTSKNATMWT